MNSRPFLAEGSKIYDETTFTTVPAQCGPNPLLVTHGVQRRVYDTTTTSIADQQRQQQTQQLQQHFQNYNFNQNQPNYGPQVVPAQQTCLNPQCVTYTFPPMQNAQTNFRELGIDFNKPPSFVQCSAPQQQQQQQPQMTLEQQIAMSHMQKNALEAMLLHDTMAARPFQLQFHRDGKTDTNDLRCNDGINFNNLYQQIRGMGISDPHSPEQLFSTASKGKYLDTRKQCQCDQASQHCPGLTSIETQSDHPDCHLTNSCEVGTCTRRVSFDGTDNTMVIPRRRKKKRARAPKKEGSECDCRNVYDDSSENSTSSDVIPDSSTSSSSPSDVNC